MRFSAIIFNSLQLLAVSTNIGNVSGSISLKQCKKQARKKTSKKGCNKIQFINTKWNKTKNECKCKALVPKIQNGSYIAVDSEDGSYQTLNILCDKGYCDIELFDFVFTTCSLISKQPYFGGVALARKVPVDSLDDFKLGLYCLEKNQSEIDFENNPTVYLTGNMELLADGVVRRTATQFTYMQQFKDNSRSLNDSPGIISGSYVGIDTEDGSRQALTINCLGGNCDIILHDLGWSTCTKLTGNPVFGGVAVAYGISKDDLDNFKLELFCNVGTGIDTVNGTPVAFLTGNMILLEGGVIRRTKTNFTYFNTARVKGDFSPTVEGFYFGPDTTDGSFQNMNILCNNRLCDVTLTDTLFSLCSEFDDGTGIFNYGIALAKGIPQDSLKNFEMNLYCVEASKPIDTNNDTPFTTIERSLSIIQDGMIFCASTGFIYTSDTFGGFSDSIQIPSNTIDTGSYYGMHPNNGSFKGLNIFCINGFCDIDTMQNIWYNECVTNNRPARLFNGVAFARDVPQDSLRKYNLELYCLDPLEQVDYGKTVPTMYISNNLYSIKGDDVIHSTESNVEFFKTGPSE